MPHDLRLPRVDRRNKPMRQLVHHIRDMVLRRLGPDLTFEQRRGAFDEVVGDARWLDEEMDLRARVTRAEEVEMEGRRYRRLEQPSSGVYQGRSGPHEIEEPLYREVGVHNGATIKPVELRAGIIHNMTPDLARVVGELGAKHTSREVEAMLVCVGMVPPSRAFIAKHVAHMAGEIADDVARLEGAARCTDVVPAAVASVSTGMDRGAVRMDEVLESANGRPRQRVEPYERTPPPPSELHYRMAWHGSLTMYDVQGQPLRTLRYATDAAADPEGIALRISADVAWLLQARPRLDVQCIQDGAPELGILPETITKSLPANTSVRVLELVDLEHLMGYLGDVVDAFESPNDVYNWKTWYRSELLHDDGAIDRIYRKLRTIGRSLPRGARKKRKVVADAISYIRTRRSRMRYASLHAARLPVGSGDTENTVWLMQQRVKRAGQSWRPPGLRGVLTLRSLVLSDRWSPAWQAYAATHRKVVRCAA